MMKLPFIRALRQAFPRARITWLAGKGRTAFAGTMAPLVRGLIDEVIEDIPIGISLTELIGRPLPDRFFDLIIDTQRRFLTTLILRRIIIDISSRVPPVLSSPTSVRGAVMPSPPR